MRKGHFTFQEYYKKKKTKAYSYFDDNEDTFYHCLASYEAQFFFWLKWWNSLFISEFKFDVSFLLKWNNFTEIMLVCPFSTKKNWKKCFIIKNFCGPRYVKNE